MCSMILALDNYNCHAYITNNYYLFILILIFLLYLHKYHLYAFLRRYKIHHHLESTCLCEFLSTYTQRSWNTTESKQPLPLVTTCSPVLFFINLPTLNFLETESWILETMVSTYSSHLHRLHGPNTVFQAGSNTLTCFPVFCCRYCMVTQTSHSGYFHPVKSFLFPVA